MWLEIVKWGAITLISISILAALVFLILPLFVGKWGDVDKKD